MEFLGKLSGELIKEGDECIVAMNSKLSELEKQKLFPPACKFLSRADWCKTSYDPKRSDFGEFSWEAFAPSYNRFEEYPFGYETSFHRVAQSFQFFEHVFAEERPDIVVSEPPSGLFHHAARYFCKKQNIPYVGLTTSRLPGRLDLFDSGHTNSQYEKMFGSLNEENITKEERVFVKEFLENLLSHKTQLHYTKYAKIHFSPLGFLLHYIRRVGQVGRVLCRYILERRKFAGCDYDSEADFWVRIRQPWRLFLRQMRIPFQLRFYRKLRDVKGRFFLFPLQVQPEASSAYLAMFYANLAETIRSSALTLPFPAKLCVKEHPSAVGSKPFGFYRRLSQIPNVVLVSPEENTQELIARSSGVITLSSTVGLEAALQGKAAYVLGNVFYSFHPLCRKVQSFEGLAEKIGQATLVVSDLEDINRRFVVSYLRNSVPGNIPGARSSSDQNDYALIAQELRKRARNDRKGI